MKTTKLLIALAIFLSQYAYAQTPDFTEAFIISWKTTTANEAIGIPTTKSADDPNLSAYDFYVDWGDESPVTRIMGFEDGDSSHVYAVADTYQIKITGTYPAFRLAGNPKRQNLVSVDQWGNIAWESMKQAFFNTNNLRLNATDTPDFSGVTDMSQMFRDATFSGNMNHWNFSSVTSMNQMFEDARAFNQDIGDWNVSGVTNMNQMFNNATAFNQDIRGWNVSGVTDMTSMFLGATAFNQDIGDWNISGVTDMSNMFSGATSFNQDIGNWNVSGVTNMIFMFFNARAFNQDIGEWNVSGVTDMSQMLNGSGLSTYHYEELLIAWNKLELQENVPLGVSDVQYRARAQTARDSLMNIHNWRITGDGLKAENEAPLALGFSDIALPQGFSSRKIPIDSLFTDPDGDPLTLSAVTGGDMAITALGEDMLILTETGIGIDSIIMTATDGFSAQATDTFYVSVYPPFDNAFMTTWKTTAANDTITIPTKGGSEASDYDFWINWGDDTPTEKVTGDVINPSHAYTTIDTFTVKITGTFPHFYLNNDSRIKDKLLSVEKWGDIAWESMANMFHGASNLIINATDTPDLSSVTDMNSMFNSAAAFNQDIGGWNVSGVTDMNSMFNSATAFNQDIGGWNVSGVTDMNSMFNSDSAFDQDISSWNVSGVTDMNSMFNSATAFDQDMSSWNVSGVTDMSSMFNSATAFDQDIGGWNVSGAMNMSAMFFNATAFNQNMSSWNVSSVTDMDSVFFDATAFNQDLSGWNVSNVTDMDSMLNGSSLSTYHYEELLIAWDKLELQKNVTLGAGDKQYRARAQVAHDSLTSATNHNWTIIDAGMKAQNDTPVVVGFSDIILSKGFSSHEIPINSLFTDGDGDPLTLSVATGSDMVITAALGEDSLTLILTETGIGVDSIIMTATDELSPQIADTFLVTVVSFDSAFITSWKTTTANEAIGIPTTNSVQDPTVRSAYDFYVDWGDESPITRIMGFENGDSSHVYAAADTYQIKITGTYPAFRLAGNLKGANLVSVDQWGNMAWESMEEAFSGATNMIIKATDVPNLSDVTDMKAMFNSASVFNQDIGDWNVSSVTDMNFMFLNATSFNQDISGWNISSVTDMSSMFSNAYAFNQDIGDWSVDSVTDMNEMFNRARRFNQDISGWNVSGVTNMRSMFSSARAFSQDLSGWNVSSVTSMSNMFNFSGLSTYYYEELLIAWDTLDLQKNVTLGATGKRYRARAQVAHDSLTSDTDHNWTINDSGMKDRNDMPVVVGFSDQVLLQGFASYKIPIASLFTDSEGDILKLTVTTGGDMAITAAFENNILTLTEMDMGVDTVYLTVNDIIDTAVQVMDTFLVTVEENNPPRIANALADLTLEKGFATHEIDISEIFEDEQPLTISVKVATEGVITAVISGDTLTLTEMEIGETEVMLIASDGLLETTETFLVTVKDPITSVEVEKELVKLYPNPTAGTVSLDLGGVEKAWIKVYTLQGSILFEKVLLENTYNLELPGSAGIYLVEIITMDNRQIIKLVRE